MLLNCARFVKPENGPSVNGENKFYSSWENPGFKVG